MSELIVACAGLLLLAAVLVPALAAEVRQAMAAQCASNMHQVYTAMQAWMQDNNQVTPIRCSTMAGILDGNPRGGLTGDWMDVEPANVAHKLAYQGNYLAWPPTAFFCPSHGLDAAVWFPNAATGDPFWASGSVTMHGTYIWPYNENDPNCYPRDDERADGYWKVLMVDIGHAQRASSLRGIHYNCLHYNGNVEVDFAADWSEMVDKIYPGYTPRYVN